MHIEPGGTNSAGISGGIDAAAAVGAPAVAVSASSSGWRGKTHPQAKRAKPTSKKPAESGTVDPIPDGGAGVANGWGHWAYKYDQKEDVTKWKKATWESWGAHGALPSTDRKATSSTWSASVDKPPWRSDQPPWRKPRERTRSPQKDEATPKKTPAVLAGRMRDPRVVTGASPEVCQPRSFESPFPKTCQERRPTHEHGDAGVADSWEGRSSWRQSTWQWW